MAAFRLRAARCVVAFMGGCSFLACDALGVVFQAAAKRSAETTACVVDGTPRRVAWVHTPKTGSSLGNMIAHYLRPDLPADAAVPDCKQETCEHINQTNENNLEFQYRYTTEAWFQDCVWVKDGHGPNNTDWFGHNRILDSVWADWDGSFVSMFRDPAQRAMSSWDSFAGVFEPFVGRLLNKEEWARGVEGTVTKLVAGQEFPLEVAFGGNLESSVVPDLNKALTRLDGFLFVGLVEHWALSVCLFHKMTASACNLHDMENSRASVNRGANETWNTSELNGYVDRFDTALYQAATARFWKDVSKHEVTKESCALACPWFDPESFEFE